MRPFREKSDQERFNANLRTKVQIDGSFAMAEHLKHDRNLHCLLRVARHRLGDSFDECSTSRKRTKPGISGARYRWVRIKIVIG